METPLSVTVIHPESHTEVTAFTFPLINFPAGHIAALCGTSSCFHGTSDHSPTGGTSGSHTARPECLQRQRVGNGAPMELVIVLQLQLMETHRRIPGECILGRAIIPQPERQDRNHIP